MLIIQFAVSLFAFIIVAVRRLPLSDTVCDECYKFCALSHFQNSYICDVDL